MFGNSHTAQYGYRLLRLTVLEQKDTALGVFVGMLNAANGTAHLKQGMMVAKVQKMRRVIASLKVNKNSLKANFC
jgi:hypothetical protein